MMTKHFLGAAAPIALIAAMLASSSALAQAVAAPSDAAPVPSGSAAVPAGDALASNEAQIDNDITVTARKRTETVQTIADPISVVTAKTIENADIRTLQDAVRLTPNLVVLDGLYPGYKTVSFRGFTTLGRDGEFPFAQIIDGVVQPGQMNFQQDLVNVQQIEILRGPQGTLYGGGAIAGAINIVTRQPTNEFQGSVTAQWLKGPEGRLNTSLTGPIIKDKLYFQAGVSLFDTEGLIDNKASPINADFGRGITSRGSLIFTPTDNLRMAATISTTDSKVGGLFLAPVPDSEFSGPAVDPSENQAGVVRTKLRNYSFKADYTFPEFATLTSITAYSRGRELTSADGDFSAESINTQNVRFVDKAWSQEFRLTSNGNGPFKWNIGAFYQDEKRIEISSFRSVNYDPANEDTFNSISNARRRYKTAAIFGQASYAITDRLEFTGGFRYDWEDQKYDSPATATSPAAHYKQKFHEPQGKASLSYKVTPDVFTYASYSRGYRKGGFNPRSSDSLINYQPETADNYEIGFKSSLLDRKVTLNGAVFYTDFNGQLLQTSRVVPGDGIFIAISNIDKTKVLGFEAEASVRPVRGLSIGGSVGYSDVKIKKFLAEDPDAFHNNRTPQIYGFTAQGSIDVDTPLSDTFDFVAHGDVTHRGSVYWDVDNTLRTPPKTFFNAKVGVRKGMWQLSFVGRNLSNERTPAAVGPHALTNTVTGVVSTLSSYNAPRQYGVELGVKF